MDAKVKGGNKGGSLVGRAYADAEAICRDRRQGRLYGYIDHTTVWLSRYTGVVGPKRGCRRPLAFVWVGSPLFRVYVWVFVYLRVPCL